MPKLELHYFASKGRSEAARLAFYIGGIPFENVHVSDFVERKAAGEYRYGQLPVLYVDDVQYTQSNAILRYAAELSGLMPSTPLDVLAAEEYVFAIYDLGPKFPANLEGNELTAGRERFLKVDVPAALRGMERGVKQRTEENSTWLVGESMTYADLCMYGIFRYFKTCEWPKLSTDFFADYPRLRRAYDGVERHPKVVEWNAAHPI